MNALDMLKNMDLPKELLLAEDDLALKVGNHLIQAQKQRLVNVPEELLASAGEEALYGFLRMESGYHVVLGWGETPPHPDLGAGWIGAVCESPATEAEAIARARELGLSGCLIGRRQDGGLAFALHTAAGETALELRPYALQQNIFSRQSGLLETDWLADKAVLIVGAGSLGSTVALQLARSGVGVIILCDTDCLEIHNICRHQLTLRDVGRYKVDALAERIHQINPQARVIPYRCRIQDVPLDDYIAYISNGKGVVLGCCDNRTGDAAASDVAINAGVPFISVGFWERAWGGELFVHLPVRHDVPYRKLFCKFIEKEVDAEHRNHLYIGEDRKEDAQIVPGISVDIEYGASLMSKTALDLLNLAQKDYKPRLIYNLGQLNWFCGTADRSAGEQWKTLLPDPLSLRPIMLPESMRSKYAVHTV